MLRLFLCKLGGKSNLLKPALLLLMRVIYREVSMVFKLLLQFRVLIQEHMAVAILEILLNWAGVRELLFCVLFFFYCYSIWTNCLDTL